MRPLWLLPLFLLAACGGGSGEIASLPPIASGDVCAALQKEGPAGPPPRIPLRRSRVRFLAFGDFGTEHDLWPQKRVASAMAAYGADHPYDFGVTLGDNFYPRGLSSPTDSRWERQWEHIYSPLGIRVYGVLGNHDYYDPRSPAAEMARSRWSTTWCLPRRQYTFTAGPVQLFAVDTTPVEETDKDAGGAMDAQRRWLDHELAASRARWKIVYGHHPIYSNGHHGDPEGFLPRMRDYLLPVLREHRVDLYLAGHDHDLEALAPEDGIHFVIAGAGGRNLRRFHGDHCRRWGSDLAYGFAVIEADETSLDVSFVGMGEGGPYRVLWGPASLVRGQEADCPRP